MATSLVDVPKSVAVWLFSHGVIKSRPTVTVRTGTKQEEVQQVTAAEWASVQSGVALGAILAATFASLGMPNPVPRMQEGTEPAVRPSGCECKIGLNNQPAPASRSACTTGTRSRRTCSPLGCCSRRTRRRSSWRAVRWLPTPAAPSAADALPADSQALVAQLEELAGRVGACGAGEPCARACSSEPLSSHPLCSTQRPAAATRRRCRRRCPGRRAWAARA